MRPVYSTTDVLLHLYYINYHVKDAPPMRGKEERDGQGLNRLWIKQYNRHDHFFFILFVFYIMEKRLSSSAKHLRRNQLYIERSVLFCCAILVIHLLFKSQS
jgi:hypothetical protein